MQSVQRQAARAKCSAPVVRALRQRECFRSYLRDYTFGFTCRAP